MGRSPHTNEERRNRMRRELLAQIEREVLGWPGVTKEESGGGARGSGFRVPPATVFRLGRRHLGHVHHNEGGLADLSFPKEVREGLIHSGKAIPHPAFPDSKTTASHELRSAEDAREVIELLRISYERAVARKARHAARTGKGAG